MVTRLLTLLMMLLAGFMLGAYATGPETSGQAQRSPQAPGGDAGDYLAVPDSADETAAPTGVEDIIETIYATLDLEVRERQRLEDQVAELTAQVAALSNRLGAKNGQNATNQALGRSSRRGALTEQALVDAGFNVAEAGLIKSRLDEIELDQLFLRDTAMREGWMGSSRYRDEIRALSARRNGMREELGESGWDRYLFAQGRPNRVTVESVLNDSPAFNAGMQPGDIIVSYEGQRVFSQRDVRTVTAAGQAGAMVAVDVLRDGSRQQMYVPRGPLGVRLGSAVIKP